MYYSTQVNEIRQTAEFAKWFKKLRDKNAQARINVRIRRVELGNFGDTKSLGDNVSELRIPYGPGYRLYYTIKDEVIVILLCGGDKSSQRSDISKAKQLVREL